MPSILICGGTDGIGFELVRIIIRDGQYSPVFVLGRSFKRIDEMKWNVVKIECDITQKDRLDASMNAIGDLDVFVNCIGTFFKSSIEQLTDDVIEEHFKVNTIGNIQVTRKALTKLKKDGHSQMLICSASLVENARENYSIQGATKAGYKYFIDTLREEYKDKIRVMTIMPASTQTQIFAKANDHRDLAEYALPEQIADIMIFMLKMPTNLLVKDIVVENRRRI